MSIHTKVLRVTDEADRTVREHAESAKIGVYDAATLLIMTGALLSRAESSGPPAVDVLADPRVIKFATAKNITPAAAVEWMIDRASRRAVNLATYAEKKKAAR